MLNFSWSIGGAFNMGVIPPDVMLKSVYDTDNDGIVDYAEGLNDGASIVISAAEVQEVIDRTTVLTGVVNPNGVVTGKLGQLYKDIALNIFYRCVSDGTQIWTVV